MATSAENMSKTDRSQEKAPRKNQNEEMAKKQAESLSPKDFENKLNEIIHPIFVQIEDKTLRAKIRNGITTRAFYEARKDMSDEELEQSLLTYIGHRLKEADQGLDLKKALEEAREKKSEEPVKEKGTRERIAERAAASRQRRSERMKEQLRQEIQATKDAQNEPIDEAGREEARQAAAEKSPQLRKKLATKQKPQFTKDEKPWWKFWA